MQDDTGLGKARVLVLEDDYYLAADLQEVLEASGAVVIGPFSEPQSATRTLADDPPDCALVDLNLGRGISFELATELARRSIPFAFVTGYDRAAIPTEFAHVARVEKPVATTAVVAVTRQLLTAQTE